MSVAASKSSAPPKGTPPVKTEPSSSGGRVTEEEIRAVLMQRTPLTTNDLVSKFKGRLKSSEVRLSHFRPLSRLTFQTLLSSVLNLKERRLNNLNCDSLFLFSSLGLMVQEKTAFSNILRRISKIKKGNGTSSYIVLKER